NVLVRLHDGTKTRVKKSATVLLDQAMPYLSERILKSPNDDFAYALRAYAWLEKKDYESALKDIDEAIRLAPSVGVWSLHRCNIWLALKEYDKAIDDCTDAVQADPQQAPPYRYR